MGFVETAQATNSWRIPAAKGYTESVFVRGAELPGFDVKGTPYAGFTRNASVDASETFGEPSPVFGVPGSLRPPFTLAGSEAWAPPNLSGTLVAAELGQSILWLLADLPLRPGTWLVALAPWLWVYVSWQLPGSYRYQARYYIYVETARPRNRAKLVRVGDGAGNARNHRLLT